MCQEKVLASVLFLLSCAAQAAAEEGRVVVDDAAGIRLGLPESEQDWKEGKKEAPAGWRGTHLAARVSFVLRVKTKDGTRASITALSWAEEPYRFPGVLDPGIVPAQGRSMQDMLHSVSRSFLAARYEASRDIYLTGRAGFIPGRTVMLTCTGRRRRSGHWEFARMLFVRLPDRVILFITTERLSRRDSGTHLAPRIDAVLRSIRIAI